MLDKRIVDLLGQVEVGERLSPEQALTIVISTYPDIEWVEAYSIASWLWFCRS